MVVVCPNCNSHIQEEHIDIEENTSSCSSCEKTFDLSYLLNTEELEQIEEIFTNPPENVKIEKDIEKIKLKFYIHSLSGLFGYVYLFCHLAFFSFLVFLGIQILRKGDFNNLVSISVWSLFLLVSIWFLYKSFYTVFGRIELVFGKESYIFQGFWRIGEKTDLDWKNVKNFYPRYSFDDNGREDPSHFGYLIIENKKITLDGLGEQLNLLLLIIKYFRYKAISESELSNNTEIIINNPTAKQRGMLFLKGIGLGFNASLRSASVRKMVLQRRLWRLALTFLKRLKALLRSKFLSIKSLNTNKNQEDIIGSYNNCAKYFSEKIGRLTIYNITYDYLIKTLNENDNILDLACKAGHISKYIKERINVNITGVDLSTEMLKLAKENIPDGTFIEDSIVTFKPDILYDYIIIGFGISYLNNEQAIQCIENSISLLKNNGHIYLSFMNGDSEGFEKISFEGDNNFYIYYHEKEKIKEILLKNGIEIITDYNIEYKEADGRITNDVILICTQACIASSGVEGVVDTKII